jgi:hypothetical protein
MQGNKILFFCFLFVMLISSCRSMNGDNHEELKANWSVNEAIKNQRCLKVGELKSINGYPTSPIKAITPGELCKESDERRYPENILYCKRSVGKEAEENVKDAYRSALGLDDSFQFVRNDMKIDHFISLCAGGSNGKENLWPQHKEYGKYTDPIEPRICYLMGKGQMMQSEAVSILTKVKTDLSTAYDVCRKLDQRIDAAGGL